MSSPGVAGTPHPPSKSIVVNIAPIVMNLLGIWIIDSSLVRIYSILSVKEMKVVMK
ncbi:hypothetical protein D3C86_2142680 [compost metagenome]